MDSGEGVFGVEEELLVGETKSAQAGGTQVGVAAAVTLAEAEMHGAINLDEQASLDAEEVSEEGTDGVLAAKLVAGQPAGAEKRPKQPLCLGH
jgi:hypothetical protein